MKLEMVILRQNDVVYSVPPVWADAKTVKAICGLPVKMFHKWAIAGDVRSKKLEGDEQRAGRIYRVSDVLEKIDELPDAKKEVANGN